MKNLLLHDKQLILKKQDIPLFVHRQAASITGCPNTHSCLLLLKKDFIDISFVNKNQFTIFAPPFRIGRGKLSYYLNVKLWIH